MENPWPPGIQGELSNFREQASPGQPMDPTGLAAQRVVLGELLRKVPNQDEVVLDGILNRRQRWMPALVESPASSFVEPVSLLEESVADLPESVVPSSQSEMWILAKMRGV